MEKLLVERGGQFMVRKSLKKIKPIPKHLTPQFLLKVGNRLTWADLALFVVIDPEKKNNIEVLSKKAF